MLGGYYLGQLYLGISGLPSAGVLSVVPSSHQLSSDSVILTQKHSILLDSSTHLLTSGNIVLTQKHLLSVENVIHTLMSENVPITSEHFIGINDAFNGLSSSEIGLVQKHTIVLENTSHSLTSGNIDIVEHKTIVVQNTTHGHIVDSIPIAVKFYLIVGNTSHSHTVQAVVLSQKHTLNINSTLHELVSDTIGGLINLQPYGMGGGFGAVDGWGVAEFGSINIELPLNFLILADDALHNLSSDKLDAFIQIFNMIRTGIYIKDFNKDGAVGSEYSKGTGTMPVNMGYFGRITPEADSNLGFLVVKTGSSGSYNNNGINSGIINLTNSGQGNLSTEVQDTGVYTKDNNNQGEYEV